MFSSRQLFTDSRSSSDNWLSDNWTFPWQLFTLDDWSSLESSVSLNFFSQQYFLTASPFRVLPTGGCSSLDCGCFFSKLIPPDVAAFYLVAVSTLRTVPLYDSCSILDIYYCPNWFFLSETCIAVSSMSTVAILYWQLCFLLAIGTNSSWQLQYFGLSNRELFHPACCRHLATAVLILIVDISIPFDWKLLRLDSCPTVQCTIMLAKRPRAAVSLHYIQL